MSSEPKVPGEFVEDGRLVVRYLNDEGVLVESIALGGPPGPLPPRYRGRFGHWVRMWDRLLWFFVPGPLKIWINQRYWEAEEARERERREGGAAEDGD